GRPAKVVMCLPIVMPASGGDHTGKTPSASRCAGRSARYVHAGLTAADIAVVAAAGWYHFVLAAGYDSSDNILVNDPYGPPPNYQNDRVWYYYSDLWKAIDNHPARDAVLW